MISVNGMKNIIGTTSVDFEFKGLSTDTKPIDSVGGSEIADNSLFLELDTKDYYYYIKGSKSEEVVLDETYTPSAYSGAYRYENLFDGLNNAETLDDLEYCIPDISKDISVNLDGTEYVCSPQLQSSDQGQSIVYYGAEVVGGTPNWDEYPFLLMVMDLEGNGFHGQNISIFNETGGEHHITIKAMSGTDGAWYKVGGNV